MKLSYRFPRRFVWGTATSALQIEGGNRRDGRGESVWDEFARKPGAVAGGDLPTVACDHYRRYRSDLALMRRLGIGHYRFSVSWARVMPSGRGPVNSRGLDFYDRVVDEALALGIVPWVTLYHWELPQALENEGGWRVRSTADAFRGYADTVVRRLGDRVKRWITLNEIPCFIGLGYETGIHAPGARESRRVVAQAYHHALLAHGHGVAAVREHGGRGAQVGLTHNFASTIPVMETPEHIAAAQSVLARQNQHILPPVLQGRYPAGYWSDLGRDRPTVARGDLALIGAPTDFLGLNIYSGFFVRGGGAAPQELACSPHFPQADLPWLKLMPQSIYWAVRHCHSLYRVRSIYITENGACYEEEPDGDGEVVDLHRREYIRNHLLALHRAVDEGLPAHGYFLWSFLDNFEWAEGYRKRFGLVHVDFRTQRRTPKLSAAWYQQVVRHRRVI